MQYYHYNSPYTAREKYKALKQWRRSSIEFTCHLYHCSERSLWRWKSQYDGTLNSLKEKPRGPRSPHPRSQSDEEKKNINNLLRRNPGIGLLELYGKLYSRYDYRRNPVTLYRYLRKIGYYSKATRSVYKPKPYITPEIIGEKWQLDVKYVPSECKAISIPGWKRFYQYTVIDEATRQRFIYPYEEQCGTSTVDFIKRAIRYFGYKPKIIQTDNGTEFTYAMETRKGKEHIFDRFCREHDIVHKLIKLRTPRHNGKVERSHRSDNERFYKNLKFYSFADLLKQMKVYLHRSNNIPMSVLKSSDGLRKWLTPMQKRADLLMYNYGVVS